MPPDHENDLRTEIRAALQSFESQPLRDAALSLLGTLGYHSDKTIEIPGSDPQAFLDLLAEHNPDVEIDQDKVLFADWLKANILFQLTDDELSDQNILFENDAINAGEMQSYLFFAIELEQKDYARGKLTAIARQLNRVFPMPVMVFIKQRGLLSIAVINRRLNKRDAEKDVLGKVTIIRDVTLTSPHRGHLDILHSFALPTLMTKKAIQNFDALHSAWEEIFNVELLNERFYKELFNWYFWALPEVRFPDDMKPKALTKSQEADWYEKQRATGLIRLLTRLIFCWFLKEKGLIPETLFDKQRLAGILKSLDDDQASYHQAILQNLFFATLNQRMNARGEQYRVFARDEGILKNRNTYRVDNLYRYESLFKDPEAALKEFEDIPFLNGGLFECLDRTDENGNKIYVDGFSRNKKKSPHISNRFFFGEGEVNVGAITGEKRRGTQKARGLIDILANYKFTIVENTPIDQEIALDPELLGKVFENLLASYNEETKSTARKQTGSFYTPRPIVDYMVDESLKAHLATVLESQHGRSEEDARTGMDILFAYTEKQHPFNDDESETLIRAIDRCKILDPACGSGAFPMGVLHKLVYILTKLDPDNARWKQTQLEKLDSAPMREELERTFETNNDDYGRKLYLIENCLYGVDIQPIAIQLSKLRFFISLICDQKTSNNKAQNHGVRPLPNLETKFVAADTLISLDNATHVGLMQSAQNDLFENVEIKRIERELQKIRHDHFAVQTRQKKLSLQKKDMQLRKKLAQELLRSTGADQITSHNLAQWDPYDTRHAAQFFEPVWMFDRSITKGFDLVIGNPPYLFISNLDKKIREGYARLFNTAEYRFDIYGFFIERAVRDLVAVKGLVSYIIPHTLLSNDSFSKLRKYLLLQTTIHQIIDIGPSVFSGASNETMTFLLSNGEASDSHKIRVRNTTASNFPEGEPDFEILQSRWLQNEKCAWPVRISNDRYELLARLSKDAIALGSICTINQGLRTGDNGRFIQPVPDGPNWRPVVGGRDIGMFEPIRPREYVLYDPTLLDAPRRREIFTSPEKIVVQEIRNITLPRRIVATLDSSQVFALQSTNVVNLRRDAPTGISLKYILAVINSSTINFFFRQNYPGNNHIASNQLATIPIHQPSPSAAKANECLVDLTMLAKEIGEDTLAQFLEELLDACVMECYFREHMQDRDLLFHAEVISLLETYDPDASELEQKAFLEHFYKSANAPHHPIRNRLVRLTADSPDLLAVIKEHGAI